MTTLRDQIISDYQERVALKGDIPSELKRALKTHERVPLFIDNLVAQINRFPKNRVRGGKLVPYQLDRNKLKMLVYSMTDIFIQGVQNTAESRYRSDLAKEAAKNKVDAFGLDEQGNGVALGGDVIIKDG